MGANFFLSSHGNNWLVDRKTLLDARREDLRYASAEEVAFIQIWTANVMHKLAKKLMLRQQVTATALVYMRRFYLKSSYCETDPALIMGACIYVAGKAEEIPVHIKSVVSEARSIFSDYGITSFPSDNTKLAEMEFYLLEDLEFHLVIFHPYRSLVELTGRNNRESLRRDAMIDVDDTVFQNAWYIINDTYRSDLCLVYPPHVIAIATLYFAFALDPPAKQADDSSAKKAGGRTDPITFLATLNVSMPLIMEVLQELIALYAIWRKYEQYGAANAGASASTPADKVVVACLQRIRDRKALDMAHPPNAR